MAEEKKTEEKKEEGHEAAEGEAKGKKKKFPVLWLIMGLLAVLGSSGGTFLFMSMKGGDSAKGKKGEHAKGSTDEHAEEESSHSEDAEAEEHGGEEEEGGHGGEGEEASAGHEGGEEGQAHCPVHDEGGGGHGAKKPTYTDTYPLEPFIVNLAGEAEKNFLKVTVKLKLGKAECTPFVDPHVAEMRDSILLLLSSKNYETIKSVQGKMELRDEILERVQHIVKGNKVKGAFFTEFVAQ